MHARLYDFTLAANGAGQIPAQGGFLKVVSATGSIRVKTDTGVILELLAGQGFRIGPTDPIFGRVEIFDLTGAANAGTIMVGDATLIDDRITGTVDVIDARKATTLANQAFYANGIYTPGTGFGKVQLTSDTTGRLILKKVVVTCGGACSFNYGLHLTQLATTVGSGINKHAGGPVGATHNIKTSDTPQAAPDLQMGRIFLPQAGSFMLTFDEPIILPKNYAGGFNVHAAVAATLFDVEFEYTREIY